MNQTLLKYIYMQNLYEAKYQYLINKRENHNQ